MRDSAISGACKPCAAIAAHALAGSGASILAVRDPLHRRSSASTSAVSISGEVCGENSTISVPPSIRALITPAGRPGPLTARKRSCKASDGLGSIANTTMASSNQRAGTRTAISAGSVESGPSTSAYAPLSCTCARTPSNGKSAAVNCCACSASMRAVRAQVTMVHRFSA